MKKRLLALCFCWTIVLLLAACGSAPGGPNPVHMNATHFAQTSITIHKGERLTLINDALTGHTIANGTWENGTARPARETGAPDVRDVQIGGISSATIGPLTTAGVFQLYCTVHPGMNLTVLVQ
ncbi:MAG TPA: plastocyanin/azurin family copper-binding protein [Ktedonobacteraceae bacterium]